MSLPRVEDLVAELARRGIDLPPGPVRCDGYGDSPELSALLLDLIRSGRKRAGTGLLWAMQHDADPMPAPGDVEIVVDAFMQPVFVTRLTRVEIKPFDTVDAAYAAIEGEGDGSLDSWRRDHWAFFSRECGRIGREPDGAMPVVCTVFELLHVVPTLGLEPHDPAWSHAFEREAVAVRRALGARVRQVDHVGSTAVPGLAAKPIIDLQVSVDALQPMAPLVEALGPLGYRHIPLGDFDRVYPFLRKPGDGPTTHHLHLCDTASEQAWRHVAFRDALRADAALAARYEQLKRTLAREHHGQTLESRERYSLAKTDFVERVLASLGPGR